MTDYPRQLLRTDDSNYSFEPGDRVDIIRENATCSEHGVVVERIRHTASHNIHKVKKNSNGEIVSVGIGEVYKFSRDPVNHQCTVSGGRKRRCTKKRRGSKKRRAHRKKSTRRRRY
jgi:hypothetical protein